MSTKITWQKLLIFIPLLITVVLIYAAGQFNRGTLVVEGEPPFTLSLNNSVPVVVTTAPLKQSLWVDQYRMVISKAGYTPYQETVAVRRGQETVVRPVFSFLPVLEPLADKRKAAAAFVSEKGVAVATTNWQQLWLAGEEAWPQEARLVGKEVERLWLAPGLARGVAVSQDDQLRWYEFATGRSSTMPSAVTSPTWSPNGKALLVFRGTKDNEGQIFLWRSASEKELLTDLAGVSGASFYWAPTGNKFSFIPSGSLAERNIYLFDLGSKRKDKLTDHGNIVALRWHPKGDQLLYETVAANGLKPELHQFTLVSGEDKILPFSLKLAKVTWLNDQALVLTTPARLIGEKEAPTLADVLDKIATAKEQIMGAAKGTAESSLADGIFRYDLKSGERKLLYTPDTALAFDEINVLVPDQRLRLRSGDNLYELQLVP